MNNTITKPQDESSALLPDDYGSSPDRTHKETGFTWRRVHVFQMQIDLCVLAGWLLFSNTKAVFDLQDGNVIRNALVFVWIVVVMVAYEAKLLFIVERRYTLIECFFVLPVMFSFLIIYMAIFTRKNNNPIGITDILAGIFVLCGTFLNTWPEIMRMQWKKRSENKGKLYTEGFFAHVRNPNYLGDVIWATGWAVASSWMVAWFPILTLCIFVFLYIPEKESYLAKRYANEWPSYEAKTVKLVPFVY